MIPRLRSAWPLQIAAALLLLSGCVGGSQLYGTESTNEKLWRLQKSGGPAQEVGTAGYEVTALACGETIGTLYGAESPTSLPAKSRLLSIDAKTGASSLIGEIANATIRGLAYDTGHHKLYGITLNELLLIDPSNAQATTIGSPGIVDFHSLAYSPATAMLYGVRASNKYLYRIDPQSGAATPIGWTGTTLISALSYDGKSFTLFGISRPNAKLVEISIDTGTATVVGPLPSTGFNGLAACAS